MDRFYIRNIKAFQLAYEFLKSNQCKIINVKYFDELIIYIDSSNNDKFGELSIYDTAVAIGIQPAY